MILRLKIINKQLQLDIMSELERSYIADENLGNLKIISAIRDPFAIRKILSHLGLSPQPPPIASARYQEDIFIS